MLWFWACIASSILWGLSYAASEHALKSGVSTFALMAFYSWLALPLFTLAGWQTGDLGSSIKIIRQQPHLLYWIILIVCCFFVANAMMYWAIGQKNASVASMIEISYPLFVLLFSWLIFRDNQFSMQTILGGGLIFVGVAVIYWKN